MPMKVKPLQQQWYSLRRTGVSRLIICMLFLAGSAIIAFGQDPAAERLVTGTVLDEFGTGMPGVNVLVSGTTIGTQTDADGKFRLNVPANKDRLYITFLGYAPQ